MRFCVKKVIVSIILLSFLSCPLHAEDHLTRSFSDCKYTTDGKNGELTLRYTVAFPVTLVIHFEGNPEDNAFTLSTENRSLLLEKLKSICVDDDCVNITSDYQKFFKKVSPGQKIYLTWPIKHVDLQRVAGWGTAVMQLNDSSNISKRFATWVRLPKEAAQSTAQYVFNGYTAVSANSTAAAKEGSAAGLDDSAGQGTIPKDKAQTTGGQWLDIGAGKTKKQPSSENDADVSPLLTSGTCRWEKGSLIAELICQWGIVRDGTLKLTWVNRDKTIGFFLRCGTLKLSLLEPNKICVGDNCDLVSLPPFTHEIKLEKDKTMTAKWTLMADGLTELAKGQSSGGNSMFELTETVSPYKLVATMTLDGRQTSDPWAAQKRAREQALAAPQSASAEPSFRAEKLPNSSVAFSDWTSNDGFGLTISNKTDRRIEVNYRYWNNGLQRGSVIIEPNGYFRGVVSRFSTPKKRYEYRTRKQTPGAPIALGVAGTQDTYEVTYRTGGGSGGELESVWTAKPKNPYSTGG